MTCASCGASNPTGSRFCNSCGAALAVEAPREQRKTVTVLFCDVTGSTALGERLDPEALRTVMARYFETARVAIERHGGTLEKFIGDAVMAVFGVPTVREDDALRAVRAAEELRDAVEIDLRIGVNTGEVVTGSGDSLVTGDAVNVAARLEQAAGSGEVLLGSGTYALVRDAVDVELLPPLEAKGKSEPLTAYRLRAVTGEAGVARRQDAPLVGRDRERRLLEDAWERARSERACALFTVLGSAGVGKSRLAVEFLDGLDALVVQGRCLSYGDGITYWPVVEVVLQLLGREAPSDPALGALIGNGTASADDIAFAVRKLFERKAAERPLVVWFDDVQWAEETFLDLIEHVADWSRDAPILLLCLARPDLLDRRPGWGGGKLNATTVLLEPLSGPETNTLIDALLAGRELEPSLRERIRAAAEGNPLFVEQMLAMVEESRGDVTVPATIQALLAARLDQLPGDERAALERGAIEGQVFHRSAVAALDGDPALILPLVRKELVRPITATLPGDDAFRFRHLLIRDAAYDALPKATRADLHERFATWLESRAPDLVELDEILGYHLEQAAAYRDELGTPSSELPARAARRLGDAGKRAEQREDFTAAASLLERAIRLVAESDSERSPLLLPLARALLALGRFDEGYRVLGEAKGSGDPDVAATAGFVELYSIGHSGSGESAEVIERTQALLAEVGDAGSDAAVGSGYLTLAWLYFWSGRTGAAVEVGEQAYERAARAGDAQLLRNTLRVLGASMVHGDATYDEIQEQVERARAVGLITGPAQAAIHAARGEHDEARRVHAEHFRHALERGNAISAYAQAISRGRFRMLAGDWDEAESILREGWNELGTRGERGFRSSVGAVLGELLGRRGRCDEAELLLDEAAELGSADDFLTVTQVGVGRAIVASQRGEHERAIAEARAAVEIADSYEDRTQQYDCWYAYAEVLLAAGRTDDGSAAAEHARDLAARKGAPFLAARAAALLDAMP